MRFRYHQYLVNPQTKISKAGKSVVNDIRNDSQETHRCRVMTIHGLSITNSSRWNVAVSAAPDNRK